MASGVAAARVADLIERTERNVGGLVEPQGEVDAEPRGEGVRVQNPGCDGVAILPVELAPQTAKVAVGAVVRGAVHPRLARGDERQARAHGPAHDRGRPTASRPSRGCRRAGRGYRAEDLPDRGSSRGWRVGASPSDPARTGDQRRQRPSPRPPRAVACGRDGAGEWSERPGSRGRRRQSCRSPWGPALHRDSRATGRRTCRRPSSSRMDPDDCLHGLLEGRRLARSRGSRPSETARALASAFWRARASVTTG